MEYSTFDPLPAAVGQAFSERSSECDEARSTRRDEWLALSLGRFGKSLGLIIYRPEGLAVRELWEPLECKPGRGAIAVLVPLGTESVVVRGIDAVMTPFDLLLPIEHLPEQLA